MAKSLVSIVIPMKNEGNILKRCFQSMENIDYPHDLIELVIINDGSTDNTKELIINHDWNFNFQYIETGGVGVSKARDLGSKKANGKYILFTDADCVAYPKWILELLKPFENDVAAVGGPNLTPKNDSPFAKCVGSVLSILSKPGARYAFEGEEVTEIHHNPTCNVMYKKEVLEEVNGFNHRLITTDDEELDYRIRKKGYRILYTPFAKVDHYRRPSWKKFIKMAYYYGLGRMQSTKMHPKMGKWFHFAPMLYVLILIGLGILSLFYNICMYIFISLIILSILGILVISIIFTYNKECGFTTFFSLINIWLYGYGVGMLRGVFK
ncbi:glycosyltransferase [Methanobacterium alcaliphilum]|uniref:glycosyltransferase n=1 Tax=Methanobacterium alcaliphilum TaxID=392018 RepID=UPI00200B8AD7|nr:glycosyltransferase [Methanobacterium alcaliphilum]MCK9150767.1 glycosyltransferase [Methanobacterium alcaliphilum]